MGYNSRFSELSWDEINELNTFVTKSVKELNSENLIIVESLHCLHQFPKFTQNAEKYGLI